MSRRLFDSNKLITQLRRLKADSTPADAERLARELIDLYGTNSIVTPVEVEVLAGVRDSHELKLTESFLQHFEPVDSQQIYPADWMESKRIAKHVLKYDPGPPGRRRRVREKNPKTPPRDFGDCLITALAARLHYDVITDDKGLIRQAGRASPG